jgi:hypothetical protein
VRPVLASLLIACSCRCPAPTPPSPATPEAPAPGAAEGAPPSVDALLKSLADVLCAAEKRCDPRPRASCRWPEFIDSPGILGVWGGSSAARAGRARPDPHAFAACERAVREAPCERVLRLFADASVPLPYLEERACRDLFDGGSADGEPCCADEECAGGACTAGRCARGGWQAGEKGPRIAAEGQPCEPTGEPYCPARMTCVRTAAGARACEPWRARAAGEACQDASDCAPPLICGPAYRCAAKGGEGDACCPEGESCSPSLCRDDLRCDFAKRACAKRLAAGEACPEFVERACAEGLSCRAGRCDKPGVALAVCRAHAECADGFACAGGRCALRGEAGSPCTDALACREGLVCNPFSPKVCVPPSAPLICENW